MRDGSRQGPAVGLAVRGGANEAVAAAVLGLGPPACRGAGGNRRQATGAVEGEGGEAVWLTAESIGDADPALAADAGRPAVFVFDEPLLARLRLSGKRLVFLSETLGELATSRPLEVRRGVVTEELAGRSLAVTWTPVPGWATRSAVLQPVEVHPWPWLKRPTGGSVTSFTAWSRPPGSGAGRGRRG